MTRSPSRGLLGRKTRALLTSLAIVLGVAMISGTFVLTDTIQKSFDGIFTDAYEKTTWSSPARRSSRARHSRADRPGRAARPGPLACPRPPPRPATCPATVKLVDEHGNPIGGDNVEGAGFSVDPEQPRLSALTLTAGRWATGAGRGRDRLPYRDPGDYGVGDTIGVKARRAGRPLRDHWHRRARRRSDLGGLSTSPSFDLATAQTVLDRQDGYDAISVAAKPGVSDAKLAARSSRCSRPICRRRRREQAADDASKDLDRASRSSASSCSCSAASRCSSARSSSSTRSRSPSRSASASWRRCARSAPHGGRSCAR